MKKYLILGSSRGIGGWQLYCASRAYYISNKGYTVYLIDARTNDSTAVKLEKFKFSTIVYEKRMSWSPASFSHKEVNAIVNNVINAIDFSEDDEVFIESTNMTGAFWGEIIAEKTNGINFSYLLHSHFENISVSTKKFFKHKLDQGLLAGMVNKTIPSLFGDYLSVKEDEYGISASWENPITDSDLFSSEIADLREKTKNGGRIIGYFGALHKPHFLKLCAFMESYINSHKDLPIAFVSIGSSFDGTAEKAQELISKHCDNAICVNFEEMYPVPRQLFEMMYVCIASWGSALAASQAGALTINLKNDVDITPYGIMGIDDMSPYNKALNSDEPLKELLEMLLFDPAYSNVSFVAPESPESYFVQQEKEDNWISGHIIKEKAKIYYKDAYKLGLNKSWVKKIAYLLFGFEKAQKIVGQIRGKIG